MNCIEELAKDAKVIEIDDQLLVLIKRHVETKLMLEEKFKDLCEVVSNFVKEIKTWGLFEGMLVYCDHENARDLEFENGLDNLWVELLERTNEMQLFITELEGLCLSAKSLMCLVSQAVVQNRRAYDVGAKEYDSGSAHPSV
nr:hypothetical protein [Tanacetum cinerariifolium]